MTLTLPNDDDHLSWITGVNLVALPSAPSSTYFDGSMMPLNEDEVAELTDHVSSGHLTKSSLCRGCLQSEGPRRIHKLVRDIDKATHILHIDIAGLLTLSDDGYTYLVGTLRRLKQEMAFVTLT